MAEAQLCIDACTLCVKAVLKRTTDIVASVEEGVKTVVVTDFSNKTHTESIGNKYLLRLAQIGIGRVGALELIVIQGINTQCVSPQGYCGRWINGNIPVIGFGSRVLLLCSDLCIVVDLEAEGNRVPKYWRSQLYGHQICLLVPSACKGVGDEKRHILFRSVVEDVVSCALLKSVMERKTTPEDKSSHLSYSAGTQRDVVEGSRILLQMIISVLIIIGQRQVVSYPPVTFRESRCIVCSEPEIVSESVLIVCNALRAGADGTGT